MGRWARQARISKRGRGLLSWALYQAALGRAGTARSRAWLAGFKAKRQGDHVPGLKAPVEFTGKQLRLIWGVWRSGTAYDPARTGGLRRQVR